MTTTNTATATARKTVTRKRVAKRTATPAKLVGGKHPSFGTRVGGVPTQVAMLLAQAGASGTYLSQIDINKKVGKHCPTGAYANLGKLLSLLDGNGWATVKGSTVVKGRAVATYAIKPRTKSAKAWAEANLPKPKAKAEAKPKAKAEAKPEAEATEA